MRFLIYGMNFPPDKIGIAKYTGDFAAWLVANDHEVRVITAPPYYPKWKVQEGFSAATYSKSVVSGALVHRCPIWVPARPSASTRILHLASFAVSSLPILLYQLFWRPHMVFLVEPPLICAPQAWLFSRLAGAKAWLHVQDFEIEAFFGLGFANSPRLKNMLTCMESFLMRRFDMVSAISNTMLARLRKLGVSAGRSRLFPNWADTESFSPPQGSNRRCAALEVPEELPVVLYSGNLGKKQGLELVLRAAESFQSEGRDALFVIAGEGPAGPYLKKFACDKGLNNVRFLSLQPENEFLSLLRRADVHLVIQKRGIADAVLPSKLTAILAVGGLAVITADKETELGRFVIENPDVALLSEPENAEILTKTILAAISLPVGRKKNYSERARAYAVRNLSRSVILDNALRDVSVAALC